MQTKNALVKNITLNTNYLHCATFFDVYTCTLQVMQYNSAASLLTNCDYDLDTPNAQYLLNFLCAAKQNTKYVEINNGAVWTIIY